MNDYPHISLDPCCLVMSSDEDQPIVMDLYAGFDARQSLTILLETNDYENSRFECETAVIVNTDDAEAMARRHGVKTDDLPAFIAECMLEWRDIINPDFRQLRDCLKEITECLLDEGCRFKIV